MRRAASWKQSALAEALGVNQTTVSRWERGQQTPSAAMQTRVWRVLNAPRASDAALRRLIETSAAPVHLVEESSHICLAYSQARARDWDVSAHALLGRSLWPYATDEIRQAEAKLTEAGWWSLHMPAERVFQTSARQDVIRISAGMIRWERLYLSDGTPVRLVTGFPGPEMPGTPV